MNLIEQTLQRTRMKLSKKSLDDRLHDANQQYLLFKKYSLSELQILKADIDSRIENMKQIGFIVLAIGFMITFFSDLIKRNINMNPNLLAVFGTFLLVVLAVSIVSALFSSMYQKQLIFQKLIDLRINELNLNDETS